ncbi:MAG: hypothetical protein MZV64_68045 [Ignavibacteriales bacterium]|nr:hypothetical protein [Ignavibacteriales bacterium]
MAEAELDADGQAELRIELELEAGRPRACWTPTFTSRVFEDGGDFPASTRSPCPSTPTTATSASACPRATRRAACCSPTRTTCVQIVTVDADGKPVSRDQAGGQPLQGRVEVVVGQERRFAGPVRLRHQPRAGRCKGDGLDPRRRRAAGSSRSSTRSGAATWCASVDPQSGHAAGQAVYIDWPGWAGRAREENGRRRDAAELQRRQGALPGRRKGGRLPARRRRRDGPWSRSRTALGSSKQMWVEHARRARTASRSTLDDGHDAQRLRPRHARPAALAARRATRPSASTASSRSWSRTRARGWSRCVKAADELKPLEEFKVDGAGEGRAADDLHPGRGRRGPARA